ncbi:hypothetical protein C8Q79DRAFT_1050523 [Trametes meyenii]|nr:hypothetical protein C8Q79DRAFT_1050523 [Trametes meyenii]
MSASQSNPKSQAQAGSSAVESKARGANRSTKVAGKLKVLPEHAEPVLQQGKAAQPQGPPRDRDEGGEGSGTLADSEEDEDEDEPEDVEVYNQIDLIPAGTARRDALRLTKKKAKSLPRVTAYATASSYRFPELLKFFNARRNSYHTNPRTIVDVIYTPYVYEPPSSSDAPATQSRVHFQSASESEGRTGDLLGVPELAPGASDAEGAATSAAEAPGPEPSNGKGKKRSKFAEAPTEAEIFIFEYGTVVIWGMTEAQERRFLSSLKRFEAERLAPQDVEMEDLNFYYASYSRIYNDVITLRKGSSYMTKLSLSHALAQSVKISLFEKLISTTIEDTKDIPEIISETGKIDMSHKEIMRKIGELFLLRTNISSVGSVLDSPTYPDLQPLYDAARSYLEIPQRIDLLNARVEIMQDMLQLLKETVTSRHGERLEQIVIALIGVEIVLGIITIVVDLFS